MLFRFLNTNQSYARIELAEIGQFDVPDVAPVSGHVYKTNAENGSLKLYWRLCRNRFEILTQASI